MADSKMACVSVTVLHTEHHHTHPQVELILRVTHCLIAMQPDNDSIAIMARMTYWNSTVSMKLSYYWHESIWTFEVAGHTLLRGCPHRRTPYRVPRTDAFAAWNDWCKSCGGRVFCWEHPIMAPLFGPLGSRFFVLENDRKWFPNVSNQHDYYDHHTQVS